MARHYKKHRKTRRSAWATYNYWYDKKSKSNPDMYYEKLTKEEFQEEFNLAKRSGLKNPAREIAAGQRKWEYKFEKKLKKETGIILTGKETKEEKVQLFRDFVDKYESIQEGRKAFEALY